MGFLGSEARVLLLNIQSQKVLIKNGSGDCLAELSEVYKGAENHHEFDSNSDVECKLEVFEKKKGGSPHKLWIRNDHHPQRSLATSDGEIQWLDVWSKSREDVHWEVEFHDFQYQAEQKGQVSNVIKSVVAFRSPVNDHYLSVDQKGNLETTNELGPSCFWGIIPAKGAYTPGGCATMVIGGTVIVAGTVASVGAVGYAAAGATAAATSAECAAAATTTAATLAAEASTAATAANAGMFGVAGGYFTGAVGTATTAATAAATAAAEATAAAATAAALSTQAASMAATAFLVCGASSAAGTAGSAAVLLPMIADAKSEALWAFKC